MPLPPTVPQPSHRHSAPSAPWPFLDIDDEVDQERIEDPDSHIPLSARPCHHGPAGPTAMPGLHYCWCKYPQSLFPNWTFRQQKKSGIAAAISRDDVACTIEYLDVMESEGGVVFVDQGRREVCPRSQDAHWKGIAAERPPGIRVRALFVEDTSGPVLQMLGTRYNIEPFFFTSSLGWAPSRYQSHVRAKESDHITITLPFIRTLSYSHKTIPPTPAASFVALSKPDFSTVPEDFTIDTQAPLRLRSAQRLLIHDLLCLHMIRHPARSSIISLHPPSTTRHTTTALSLKTRLHLAGRSVYWKSIFSRHKDPTFVFLSLLWYVLYAWDEAIEALYAHICVLEMQIMHIDESGGLTGGGDIHMSNELHLIRAHILHYGSLLIGFKKTAIFLGNTTPYPALFNDAHFSAQERKASMGVLKMESERLVEDIERLEESIDMVDKRLKNVMDLGFSMVNIEDSRRMRKLTEAAVRDSAAMKQISYLSMVFLPSGFVAAAFGMNITSLQDHVTGTVGQYIAIAIPLTVVTIWIIVAYQIQITAPLSSASSSTPSPSRFRLSLKGIHSAVTKYKYYGPGYDKDKGVQASIWTRLWWPLILLITVLEKKRKQWIEKKETRRGAQES